MLQGSWVSQRHHSCASMITTYWWCTCLRVCASLCPSFRMPGYPRIIQKCFNKPSQEHARTYLKWRTSTQKTDTSKTYRKMNLKTSPIPPNMLQQRSQQTAISCYKWGTPKMLQRLSHWKAPVSLFFGYPSLPWKASLTRNLGCSFKHYICIDEYIYG